MATGLPRSLAKSKVADIVNLTDDSGGIASDTLELIGAAYSQTAIANNFADLAAKVNEILDAIKGE